MDTLDTIGFAMSDSASSLISQVGGLAPFEMPRDETEWIKLLLLAAAAYWVYTTYAKTPAVLAPKAVSDPRPLSPMPAAPVSPRI